MLPLLPVLVGCFLTVDDHDTWPAQIDCGRVALRDADGTPDGCDVAACLECSEACGTDCAVLESYPPRYSCGSRGTWDVYDICPDWTPPVRVENVTDLGCGTATEERLTAVVRSQGTIEVTHSDFAQGCCPTSIEVGVRASASTLLLEYTIADDPCECICGLDVRYTLVGVSPGDWTLLSSPSGARAEISVP
jgi:hypothetical protein